MTETRLSEIRWEQDMHCCGPEDLGSHDGGDAWLKIRIVDGGGGPYLAISAFEWAIDPKDEETIEQAVERIRGALI